MARRADFRTRGLIPRPVGATNKGVSSNSRSPHPPRVRSAARALVLHQGRLLVIVLRDQEGEYHLLPGGGQEHGETLTETLAREVFEETGAAVAVGPLAYVREYIGKNHSFSKRHREFHQIESVFLCTLVDDSKLILDQQHDNRQVGVAWLPVERLPEVRFYPAVIKPWFRDGGFHAPHLYLGDNN